MTVNPPTIADPADAAVLAPAFTVSGTAEDGTVSLYDGPNLLFGVEPAEGKFSADVQLDPGAHKLWATLQVGEEVSASSNEVNVSVETPVDPPAGAPTEAGDPAPSPRTAPDPSEPTPEPTPEPSEPAPSPDVVEGSTEPAGGTTIDAQANAVTATEAPVEDVAAPAAPDVPDAPVIEEPHGGQVLEESLVTVSGTGAAGNTVTVWADSRSIGSASVDSEDNWSLEASLPNGEYQLTATADDTGRISARSEPVDITVNFDSSAPPPEVPSDPDEAFAQFLRSRVLRGYPLNWQLIMELRAAAQDWLDSRHG